MFNGVAYNLDAKVKQADALVESLLLEEESEVLAAIFMIEGRQPTQQEWLDRCKLKVKGRNRVYSWKGKEIVDFPPVWFDEENMTLHRPANWIKEGFPPDVQRAWNG